MAEEESYSLIPPEGDPKVGEKVFEVLGKIVADKIKLGLHDRWMRNYKLRRNLHFKSRPEIGKPLVSANLLYTHGQRTTNTMTDNDPTFNVAAVGQIGDRDKEQLADLQRCTEHWWRDQEQQDVFESSVINGEQYGIAIEKVVFNPELEYGLGEVETITVDPFHFGWYPVKLTAARDLQKSEALCHFYPVPVRALKARYPQFADRIKPDSDLARELMDDDRREAMGSGSGGRGGVMASIGSTIRELINFVGGAGGDDEEETLLCEMWLRDKSQIAEEVEEEIPDEATGTRRTVKKRVVRPKYRGEIRYILACSGGKAILEDRDNPNIHPSLPDREARNTYLYDKFPFTACNSLKDTSSAWGMSDFEQLEWLNMEVDKALSQFVLEKDWAAKKKLVNPLDSGVPNSDLTNVVSIINPASAASSQGIRWLEPPQSNIDYDKALQVFKDLFFLISGTFELDQAQVQGRDVIAYKAIAALLERAATMMRGKIRSYSRLIRDRGRMYLSHVMNFYTEERWITYRDKEGKEASKAIIGASLVMPAKLTVVSGSTLPISRVQQREEAIALFGQRAIDQQELLERLDYSNRNEVIKRMMAGPFGAFLERMATAQVPPQILQYIKTVSAMEPKDLEKALKDGKIPPFVQFLQQAKSKGKGGQPGAAGEAGAGEMQAQDAEVRKTLAEAELVLAKRDLTVEQIMSEKIKQRVQIAGVAFDEETLKMERARIVSDIEAEAKSRRVEGIKAGLDFVSKAANRPGYNEQGLRSNNVTG